MSAVRQRKKHSKQKDENKIIHSEKESSSECVSVVNLRNITGKLQLMSCVTSSFKN